MGVVYVGCRSIRKKALQVLKCLAKTSVVYLIYKNNPKGRVLLTGTAIDVRADLKQKIVKDVNNNEYVSVATLFSIPEMKEGDFVYVTELLEEYKILTSEPLKDVDGTTIYYEVVLV